MKVLLFCIVILCLFATGWSEEENVSDSCPIPFGLPPVPWPVDNPYSSVKAELGRLLFSDARLSSDNTISCATCHSIPKGFTDHHPLPEGIHGRRGTRHTPTIINTAYNSSQFWDGRALTLEEQALGPIGNPNEMTLECTKEEAYHIVLHKIHKVEEYKPLFSAAFGREECTMEDIAKAIATFERTLLSGNSPFDRYQAGETTALTREQIHGFEVFKQVGCIVCHSGPNFTESSFANIGIGMNKEQPDLGRFEVTRDPNDWGAFKVPTLRQVRQTGPYMHDGSLKTLKDVVEYYDQGGIPNLNLDSLMRPLHLSSEEKHHLVLFLKSLNGEGFPDMPKAAIP